MSIQDPDARAPELGSGLLLCVMGMVVPIALLFGLAISDAVGPVTAVSTVVGSAALVYLGVQRSVGTPAKQPGQPGSAPPS